jgi:hypothetical protein
MGAGWLSSDAVNLTATVDPVGAEGESASSTRLVATAGSAGRRIALTPAAPIDLGAFDEMRFWVRSSRPARGTAGEPFYLAFAYHDAADVPTDEHRWLVPVGRADRWQQVVVGIEADRRTAIDELRFESRLPIAWECRLDELRAVRPDMLRDAREAFERRLAPALVLPELAGRPLVAPTTINGTSAVIGLARGFAPGNLVELRDATGAETHSVTAVTHNVATGRTTLQFANSDQVTRVFGIATGRITALVPILDENPPAPLGTTSPALQLGLLDLREDPERSPAINTRDSFRIRSSVTVCSVRPAPRAYIADYQLTVVAPLHDQGLALREAVLRRISIDEPLPIHGVGAPVWILPPPTLEHDDPSIPARIHARLGLHMAIGARAEQPWIQRAEAIGGQLGAPDDREGIVLQL